MPLIRYRTGDIASILPGRCACGALLSPRIGKMPQKLGMIHRLSTGESLYASLCDEALYEVDDLVDYRLFIGMREDGIETIECRTERIGNADDYRARVAEALGSIGPIRNAIDAGALVVLPVVVVERGELRRGGRTLKRKIEDVRDGGLDNEE